MKKLLCLIFLVFLFSCEKRGDGCWECSRYTVSAYPHEIIREYCGDFAGMKALEKQKDAGYTNMNCSLKP